MHGARRVKDNFTRKHQEPRILEAYLGPHQTSDGTFIRKYLTAVTIFFKKFSITDIWQGPEYKIVVKYRRMLFCFKLFSHNI